MDDCFECFWLRRSDLTRVSLKRWNIAPCRARDGLKPCEAMTPLLTMPASNNRLYNWPHTDIRWPASCAYCGFSFEYDDARQLVHERLYTVDGDDYLVSITEAPPGAMWDAYWHEKSYKANLDGVRLVIKLPNGAHWEVDRCPSVREQEEGAKGETVWVREGTIPAVTASPSVVSDVGAGWKGSLIEGWLVPDSPPSGDNSE